MFFGTIKTQDAAGAILAHSEQANDRRIRKGQVLDLNDVSDLIDAGRDEITIARLEAGDVHEDMAATRLAEALAGQAEGTYLTRAATGRVNLVAERPGLARVDADAIASLNACDPAFERGTTGEGPELCEVGVET